jgi:hypothetical protein
MVVLARGAPWNLDFSGLSFSCTCAVHGWTWSPGCINAWVPHVRRVLIRCLQTLPSCYLGLMWVASLDFLGLWPCGLPAPPVVRGSSLGSCVLSGVFRALSFSVCHGHQKVWHIRVHQEFLAGLHCPSSTNWVLDFNRSLRDCMKFVL